VDQAPFDPGTEEVVCLGLGRMHHALEECVKTGKGKTAENASQIMATYFGMRVMAKAGVPLSMLEQARDGILQILG